MISGQPIGRRALRRDPTPASVLIPLISGQPIGLQKENDMLAIERLNPFDIRATDRTSIMAKTHKLSVLIPLISGQPIGPMSPSRSRAEAVLIPLISGQPIGRHHGRRMSRKELVLIPLISGQPIGHRSGPICRDHAVLIPLISGQPIGPIHKGSIMKTQSLNPFDIRATDRTLLSLMQASKLTS